MSVPKARRLKSSTLCSGLPEPWKVPSRISSALCRTPRLSTPPGPVCVHVSVLPAGQLRDPQTPGHPSFPVHALPTQLLSTDFCCFVLPEAARAARAHRGWPDGRIGSSAAGPQPGLRAIHRHQALGAPRAAWPAAAGAHPCRAGRFARRIHRHRSLRNIRVHAGLSLRRGHGGGIRLLASLCDGSGAASARRPPLTYTAAPD